MAQFKKSVNLKNVHFELDDLLGVNIPVQEINKEETLVYNLAELLKNFAGSYGVTISISQSDDVVPAEE